MPVIRKLSIITATGVIGFIGYKSLASSRNEIDEDFLSSEANKMALQKAISSSRQMLLDLKKETSTPGMTIAVSVDGNLIWKEGLGYKDLENKALCSPRTVMKIASISKCITSVILAKEIEKGSLNLDEDISKLVTNWPQKYWQKKKVKITPRLLACHMGGIRGYKPIEDDDIVPAFRYEEYHITEKFMTITDALKLFQNDPLIANPGEKFIYSNHGYTLLSAALEKSSKMTFKELLTDTFRELGMENTFVDDPHLIIYDKSRHYSVRDGAIVNAPYVESSFKIAAAGLLSTSVDLVRFANVLLSSYFLDDNEPDGLSEVERYIKKETLDTLWSPVDGTSVSWNEDGKYGLGWQIVESKDRKKVFLGHTGKSVGTSSVLSISLPLIRSEEQDKFELLKKGLFSSNNKSHVTKHVVVAILANLEGVSLGPVAIKIADEFHLASKD